MNLAVQASTVRRNRRVSRARNRQGSQTDFAGTLLEGAGAEHINRLGQGSNLSYGRKGERRRAPLKDVLPDNPILALLGQPYQALVNVLNHGKPKLWTMVFCVSGQLPLFCGPDQHFHPAPFLMKPSAGAKLRWGSSFRLFRRLCFFMIPVAVDGRAYKHGRRDGMGILFTCITPFFLHRIDFPVPVSGRNGTGIQFPAVNQWIARHVGVSDRAKVGFYLSGSCWPR